MNHDNFERSSPELAKQIGKDLNGWIAAQFGSWEIFNAVLYDLHLENSGQPIKKGNSTLEAADARAMVKAYVEEHLRARWFAPDMRRPLSIADIERIAKLNGVTPQDILFHYEGLTENVNADLRRNHFKRDRVGTMSDFLTHQTLAKVFGNTPRIRSLKPIEADVSSVRRGDSNARVPRRRRASPTLVDLRALPLELQLEHGLSVRSSLVRESEFSRQELQIVQSLIRDPVVLAEVLEHDIETIEISRDATSDFEITGANRSTLTIRATLNRPGSKKDQLLKQLKAMPKKTERTDADRAFNKALAMFERTYGVPVVTDPFLTREENSTALERLTLAAKRLPGPISTQIKRIIMVRNGSDFLKGADRDNLRIDGDGNAYIVLLHPREMDRVIAVEPGSTSVEEALMANEHTLRVESERVIRIQDRWAPNLLPD